MIFQVSELTCTTCSGPAGLACSSLDCPALYRRRAAVENLKLMPTLEQLLEELTDSEAEANPQAEAEPQAEAKPEPETDTDTETDSNTGSD